MTKKIMVIDDDRGILNAISTVLEYAGYEVETSPEVNKAVLKGLVNSSPDAIVLDISLSGKDGRKVAKKLKSNVETMDIPILMISAHPEMEESAKKNGANDFLPKPFNFDEIISKLEVWIN